MKYLAIATVQTQEGKKLTFEIPLQEQLPLNVGDSIVINSVRGKEYWNIFVKLYLEEKLLTLTYEDEKEETTLYYYFYEKEGVLRRLLRILLAKVSGIILSNKKPVLRDATEIKTILERTLSPSL